MLELGPSGSVRGALSNERPYRNSARIVHRAIDASATMVVFRRRPPLRSLRSLNQIGERRARLMAYPKPGELNHR